MIENESMFSMVDQKAAAACPRPVESVVQSGPERNSLSEGQSDAPGFFGASGSSPGLGEVTYGVSSAPQYPGLPPETACDEIPDTTANLLDAVSGFIRRFVVLSVDQACAIALWVLHTHALDAAEATPYLAITSAEKRCGKTRLLEILRHLVYNPWMTGRVSAAVLVRKVESVRLTLLLDESDAAFGGNREDAEALRGILNTGHRRGGVSSLCVKNHNGEWDFKDFNTFCPKAISGIGNLPDTVADRSVPIRLKRKNSSDRIQRYRGRDVKPEARQLFDRIVVWAGANLPVLSEARPSLPDALGDRAADGAEPLLAIADLAQGRWPTLARECLVALCGDRDVEEDSVGVRLLRDIRTIFDRKGGDRISSAELVGALLWLEESPWAELERGGELTVRRLARLLSPFSIHSGTIRLENESTPKGYYRASFEDAWGRYLPQTDVSSATTPQVNAAGASGTMSERHGEQRVADQEQEIFKADSICGVVAVADPLADEKELPAGTGESLRTAEPCDYHCGSATDACERCGYSYPEHVWTGGGR